MSTIWSCRKTSTVFLKCKQMYILLAEIQSITLLATHKLTAKYGVI